MIVSSTSTKTVTQNLTITIPHVRKRNPTQGPGQITVSPTAVPPYAAACSGTVRYRSACSCWGITQSTSTAPTPTKWETKTVTRTVTATVALCTSGGKVCDGKCRNLQSDKNHCGNCDRQVSVLINNSHHLQVPDKDAIDLDNIRLTSFLVPKWPTVRRWPLPMSQQPAMV
jgi:hypothetical protein